MKKITCFVLVTLALACKTPKPAEPAKAVGDTPPSQSLEGTWELNYISGPRIAFEGLYPDRKPEITVDLTNKRISGHTGCNSFNGPLTVSGNKIDFSQPMAMTKKACMGEGEPVFLKTLSAVDTYTVTEGGRVLNFISGDIATLRFVKK